MLLRFVNCSLILLQLFSNAKEWPKNLNVHIGLVFWDGVAQWVDPLEPVNWVATWKKMHRFYEAYMDAKRKKDVWPPEGKEMTRIVTNNRREVYFSFHNDNELESLVLCSRYTTCWDFDTFIDHAAIDYSDEARAEGTVATIMCGNPFRLNGKLKKEYSLDGEDQTFANSV